MFKPFRSLACAYVFGLIVDGRAVDVQYSNWENGHPNNDPRCVIVTQHNYWNTGSCNDPQKYVCQS